MFGPHGTAVSLNDQHLVVKWVYYSRSCESSSLLLSVVSEHRHLSWYSWRIMESHLRIVICCISFSPSSMRRLSSNQMRHQSSLSPKGSITPISKPYRGNVSGQDIITHHWKRRANQIKCIRRSKWATELLHESFIHFRDCRTVLQEHWIKDRIRLSKMIIEMLCKSCLSFQNGLTSWFPTPRVSAHE